MPPTRVPVPHNLPRLHFLRYTQHTPRVAVRPVRFISLRHLDDIRGPIRRGGEGQGVVLSHGDHVGREDRGGGQLTVLAGAIPGITEREMADQLADMELSFGSVMYGDGIVGLRGGGGVVAAGC